MRQITKGKVLALALVLAAVTAFLVYYYMAKQERMARLNTPIVVAEKEIPRGTVISEEMLRTATVRRDAVQPGAATATEMVVGRVANDRFGPGDPIVLSGIVQGGFPNIVPPFMRAVTVALDPIIGVGGFLKPGDHVDVVATFNVNNGTVTKTVLQNVLLLAAGAEIVAAEGKKGDKPVTQPNATLAVMPTDAEKLILAESKGKLRLTLRRPDDVSFVATRGVTGRSLIGSVPPDAPQQQTAAYNPYPNQPARPAATTTIAPFIPAVSSTGGGLELPKEKTVMVIRGTKVEEAVVQE